MRTKPANKPCPAGIALAIGAHPDDIEFGMAGTLLLLRAAGWQTHYLNLAGGNCGSLEQDSQTTRSIRAREARHAARILGAQFHPSLANDLEILYELRLLRRLAAIIREVKPSLVLTHPPQDYMEDHTNTCRLAVTAAFAHGMPNFKSLPARSPYQGDVALFHCLPHGLRDPLRRRVIPSAYVNTTSVQATKREALAAHKSQQTWLDSSQGLRSPVAAMEAMARESGRQSGQFRFAEGWLRHLHLGLAAQDADPLALALGRDYRLNPAFEASTMD